MASVNVEDYIAEDKLQPKDIAPRFGVPFEVTLDLNKFGVWTELPNGDRVWRLRIKSEGAYSINLVFDRFHMPKGGQLFIYNDDYRYVIGAFTESNNKETGMFSTQPVPDDAITLEYLEPSAVRGEGDISVMRVVHAYRNVFGYRDPGGNLDSFGESVPACNNNVACDSEWDDQERGVVMLLTSGGWRFCSGSLINNSDEDETPYILTANHCDPDPTSVAMFNYKSPNCSPTTNGPTYQTVSSGTERFNTSSNFSSDCFLWELSSNVPLSYDPYFNGFDGDGSGSTSSVGIHHPSGDVMKISWDDDAAVSSTYGYSSNTHWKIEEWEDGTTEGGSSGSPLFDQNHRIIGQLHGGTAACNGSVPNDEPDYYGKLSVSMSAGLDSWLGTTVMDGYDPNASTPTITVTNPNTAVTWIAGSSYTITWTSTGLSENVQIHINRSYPSGTWETITTSTANDGSYSWAATTPATSSARIRIRGVTSTTVSDISDANFTIAERTITVTNPNSSVTWIAEDSETISWTSQYVTGNVKIEINRSYPSGGWETITSSTTNDGSYNWTVDTPTSSAARIRVTSLSYPTVSDVSNTNFSIVERSITVTNPNTAVTWIESENVSIEWSSDYLTGNVSIELNRSYPGGSWETISSSTTDDGDYSWSVTLPATTTARVRVTSLTYPAVSDESDVNFTITVGNLPPEITHDRLDDQDYDSFDVTADVSDDDAGFVARLFTREAGTADYDSLELSPTYNGDEHAVSLTMPVGSYEYFLRVIDAGGLSAATSVYTFDVQDYFGIGQQFDDGSAEASHWSETETMKWAVKFDAGVDSYVLSNAKIGVSAEKPASSYSELIVSLYLADGVGGIPGTLVDSKTIGSLGNVIGGVPTTQDNFVDVVFLDASDNPLVLTDDFFIAVENSTAGYDAFLHDENGTVAGRSYVYNSCEEIWIDETSVHESARPGNRMIRAFGFSLTPPNIVAYRNGSDLKLDWDDTGAPYYKIYSSLDPDGPVLDSGRNRLDKQLYRLGSVQ